MKRLFMVYVETEVCVLAKDETEAARLAIDHAAEERDNATAEADEISLRSMFRHWIDCLPYGGDGRKTCGELFDEIEAAEAKAEGEIR